MGNRLAKAAASLGYAAASSEERSGALRMTRGAVVLKRRKIAPPLLAWAELLLAAADDDKEGSDGDGGGSTTYAPPSQSNYGAERFDDVDAPPSLEALFKSPWWARFYAAEITTLHAAALSDGATRTLEIVIVSRGSEWAIVNLPVELFVELESEIRSRSRFKHTAVNTLSNGHVGYVPTRAAFDRSGGYETKLLTSSHLAPDAGEMLVKRVGDLLDEAWVEV